MSELARITEEKCLAARLSAATSLQRAIDALKSREAAKGNLYSGFTAKRVLALCQDALSEFGRVATGHYEWHVRQALVLGPSKLHVLVSAAAAHVALLHDACAVHIEREFAFLGAESSIPNCLSELRGTHSATAQAMRLSLESRFAEQRCGLLRSLLSRMGGLASKLVGLRP